MLAVLLLGIDGEGNLWVINEFCQSGLTLSEAAVRVSLLCCGHNAEIAVCSPDLWNRRQDSGKSGFEIMQQISGMPPMISADDRRVPGWRVLREYLCAKAGHPFIRICSECHELIKCLPSLLCDSDKTEDASDTPHKITHAPEALRYAVMSRICADPTPAHDGIFPFLKDFKLPRDRNEIY